MGEPAEKSNKEDLEGKVLTHPALQRVKELGSSESSGFYQAIQEAEKSYKDIEQKYNESEQKVKELEQRLEKERQENERQKKEIDRLKPLAIKDGLTAAFNHRYFVDQLEAGIKEASAENKPLSILMIDIDHFKEFNDNYGHKAGDYVLKQLSFIANTVLRDTDIFARYGGEEFAVIMPNTNEEEAEKAAERLRKAVENAPLHYIGQKLDVTISIGVAPYTSESVDDLIIKADQPLYAAKDLGRNCVVSRSYAKELGIDLSLYGGKKANLYK
ncbi:diguanylate cyclase [Candidatus Woesearchaeota archaeon]|nr:diguanylate cyclase [Candidatus Woesearchaeota archaeon]